MIFADGLLGKDLSGLVKPLSWWDVEGKQGWLAVDLFPSEHPRCPAQALCSEPGVLCASVLPPLPAKLGCASSVAKPADGAPAHGALLRRRLESRASLGRQGWRCPRDAC